MMMLSAEDRYALARVLAGLEPHPQVAVSPLVGLLIQQWRGRRPNAEDVDTLRTAFGNELIAQIFAVDPHGPAPVQFDAVDVPRLPDDAQVSDAQRVKALRVGKWLDDFMEHAKQVASMTDDVFLESGGLWLIGLACARRVGLKLDFQTIYNTHYVLWVAPTTYYRKSTGLRVVERIARDYLSHLLLAGQSTPETLLGKLAGQKATNFDDLDKEEQNRELQGIKQAAQRGFISDEVSKLFAKDYMKGLPEMLMEMAEAPQLVEHEYKGVGKLVVKQAGLSLLFATTPSRLQRIFGDEEWEDGLLPRFALLTPTGAEVVRSPAKRRGDEHSAPANVTDALEFLKQKLPQPRDLGALDDQQAAPGVMVRAAQITDEALEAFNRYADALHVMTDPRGGLDYRLAGVYGRLPVHGLRVALSLAAIDWASAGGEGEIVLTDGHWYRAQIIVEDWRASAHRLLMQVNRGQDQVYEEKVLKVLRMHHPKPPTQYEIYKRVGGQRQAVYGAIDALFKGGVLVEVNDGARVGYQLAEGR